MRLLFRAAPELSPSLTSVSPLTLRVITVAPWFLLFFLIRFARRIRGCAT